MLGDQTTRNDSVETLQHLFWECPIVNQFWQNLLQLIHEKCHHCTRFYFCPELILFGFANEIYTDRIMDFIILFAKFYIYKCKLNELRPDILSFLRQLKKGFLLKKKFQKSITKAHGLRENGKCIKDYLNLFKHN